MKFGITCLSGIQIQGTKGIIPNRKGNAWQIANLGDH